MHAHGYMQRKLYVNKLIAELTPFSAVPLFGPEAGGTLIRMSYRFRAHGVITSYDLSDKVTATLNGQELAATMQ